MDYLEKMDPREALREAAELVQSGTIAEVVLEYTLTKSEDYEERLTIEVRGEVKPWPSVPAAVVE